MRLLISGKHPDKLFNYFLAYLMVLVLIMVSVLAFSLYISFRGTQLSNYYSFSTDSLRQISTSESFMTDSVKSLIAQESNDIAIRQLLYQHLNDPGELVAAIDRLNSIVAQNYFYSIYVYNGESKTFYSSTSGMSGSSDFFDQDIVKMMNNPQDTLVLKPIPRKVTLSSSSGDYKQSINVYTYFFNEFNKSNNEILCSIIVNVSEAWMRNSIDALDKSKTGKILVIDKNGRIVSGTFPSITLSDISNLGFVKRILNAKSTSGYFIGEVDGSKSLITYVSSDSQDWKFIMYTPYGIILKQLAGITIRTVFICFFILLIGLLTAYYVSKRIYKPVKGMQEKLDSQYNLAHQGSNKLKQDFLSEILLSEKLISMEKISNGLNSFKLKLNPEKPILLILLRVDYYSVFKVKYSHKNQSLLKFGIMNIALELLEPIAPSEAIDLNGDHVALLLTTEKQPTEESKNALKSIIRNIQDSVSKYLDISITAAVSSFGSTINQLNFLYTETLNITYLRMFSGPKSVFFLDSENCLTAEDYEYPIQKEKLLSDCIMLCKFDDAEAYCIEILDSTRGYPHSELTTTILRLFFANVMTINSLEAASGFRYFFDFNDFYFELTNLDFIEDIKNKFSSLYKYLIQKQKDKKSNKYNDLINKVDEIINTNYMMDDLCLDSIADSQSMSSIYLGRLYKKYSSKSVGDRINEVRLEKATELLTGTDESISEIARITGFSSNSYFGALFKKFHGTTPNEFRQKAKMIK